MTKIKKLFIFSAFVLFSAFTYPDYTGYVNDYAGFLSTETKEKINSLLTEVEKKTSAEIAILTVPDLSSDTIENYAVKVFEQWKIGKKGKDNGILFVIAKEEREVRIEVGYGLESVITDGRAGDIIRKIIIPNFKEGNYEKGIVDAVLIVSNDVSQFYNIKIDSISSEQINEIQSRPKWRWIYNLFYLLLIILVISGRLGLFGLLFLSSGRGGYWSSGRGGFGGGGFGGFGGGGSGGGGASGRW